MFNLNARARLMRVHSKLILMALLAVTADPQSLPAPPQQNSPQNGSGPIDFESHGMHYEALTRSGITVMFAPLPPHVKEYNIVQVTVTNGSPVSWTVKPSDFSFTRHDGTFFKPFPPMRLSHHCSRRLAAMM